MKAFYVFIALVFCNQLIFSQSVCGVKEIEDALKKATTENQEIDQNNDLKYQKALSQLSKVKKWTPKEEASYGLKMLSNPAFIACEENKAKFMKEMIDVLMTANEKVTDANNCKVLDLTLEKLRLGSDENKKEWQLMMEKISKDYKLVTNKDLVIE